jgi:hypothetical protein
MYGIPPCNATGARLSTRAATSGLAETNETLFPLHGKTPETMRGYHEASVAERLYRP